jgi:hypothetical protein
MGSAGDQSISTIVDYFQRAGKFQRRDGLQMFIFLGWKIESCDAEACSYNPISIHTGRLARAFK